VLRLAPYNIRIDVSLDKLLIAGLTESDYINFHEITSSYETKNVQKLNQIFQIAVPIMHLSYVLRKISIIEYSY